MQKQKGVFYIIAVWLLLFIPALDTAHAGEVYTAVGLSLPPYVIKDKNSGMEFDIVREALAFKGHTLKPRFVSLKQVPVVYAKKVVDAAMTVTEDFNINAFYSDVVISYQNYAITLKHKNITINSISDLKNKRIVAFQNAKIYLGPEYRDAVSQATYREVKHQIYQIHRLYMGRTDVVISDRNIFTYYRNKAQTVDTTPEPVFHPIFEANHYKMAFRDSTIRDDFNEGLRSLRKSGRYDEILRLYVNE